MRELQKRQNFRRIIRSVPFLLICLVITFLLAKSAVTVVDKSRESAALARNLEARAAQLATREQELTEDIARLETEEGVREEIKDKFSVTQEGEFVAVIVDERRATSSGDRHSAPWYKRLWAVITKVK